MPLRSVELKLREVWPGVDDTKGLKEMTRRVLPNHVGFIPDGNRRWAGGQGLSKQSGYQAGIEPGLVLYEMCKSLGIPEVSIYGFTKDNTKSPPSRSMPSVWPALRLPTRLFNVEQPCS